MSRFYKKRSQTEGQAPGTVVFIGQRKMDKPTAVLLDFDETACMAVAEVDLEQLPVKQPVEGRKNVWWMNVDGLHDVNLIKKFGDTYGIHPLIQEDIANTGQRAKFEELDDYIFISLKTLNLSAEGKVLSEQLGIVFNHDKVFTFKETPSDLFDFLFKRLQTGTGKLRTGGPDYVAFAILDSVVDDYLFLIEELGQRIENLEIALLNEPARWMVASINHYKRELNYLSKTIRPVREMVLDFYRNDSDMIQDKNRPFVHDLLDLVTHAIETIDSYRDMLSDYLHIYNARQNNQLTEVMRVLTVFSTVFIPLTFLAGVYGTNFDNVPGYHTEYGFYVFSAVCGVVAVAVLVFMKFKKWV